MQEEIQEYFPTLSIEQEWDSEFECYLFSVSDGEFFYGFVVEDPETTPSWPYIEDIKAAFF